VRQSLYGIVSFFCVAVTLLQYIEDLRKAKSPAEKERIRLKIEAEKEKLRIKAQEDVDKAKIKADKAKLDADKAKADVDKAKANAEKAIAIIISAFLNLFSITQRYG
jgi:hypothetical protein